MWLRSPQAGRALLPTSPLAKAVAYALEREAALGRKKWMFCRMEIMAQYADVIQGLLSTCRLQRIDPYTSLVDVLQRVQAHPAATAHELALRAREDLFTAEPPHSDLERVAKPEISVLCVNNGAS